MASERFHFRLQTVLDFRAEQVNRIQLKVAQEERKARAIQDKIQAIDTGVVTAIADQNRMMSDPNGWDPILGKGLVNYLQLLRQYQQTYRQMLARQDQVLNTVRQELRQAVIGQKSLEILKEKEARRHRRNMEKTEENFLSELALNRMYHAQAAS